MSVDMNCAKSWTTMENPICKAWAISREGGGALQGLSGVAHQQAVQPTFKRDLTLDKALITGVPNTLSAD